MTKNKRLTFVYYWLAPLLVILFFFAAWLFHWTSVNNLRLWLRDKLTLNKIFFDVFVSLSLSGASLYVAFSNYKASAKKREEEMKPYFSGKAQTDGVYEIYNSGGNISRGIAVRQALMIIRYTVSDKTEDGKKIINAGHGREEMCTLLVRNSHPNLDSTVYDAENKRFYFQQNIESAFVDCLSESCNQIELLIKQLLIATVDSVSLSIHQKFTVKYINAAGGEKTERYIANWNANHPHDKIIRNVLVESTNNADFDLEFFPQIDIVENSDISSIATAICNILNGRLQIWRINTKVEAEHM